MSKELPPSRTADQFVVRVPDGMRDKIAEAAKANNRSMNAEIISRLETSLDADSIMAPDALGEAMVALQAQIIDLRHRVDALKSK